MILTATVTEDYKESRLDQFLVETIGDDITRSSVQKWIRGGFVKKDNIPITKNGYKVEVDEVFTIQVPAKPKTNLEPTAMDIPVLWEDEYFLLVHKKPGIATHPGPGDRSTTLVNGLLHQFPHLSGINGGERPGIVHRLDKPTEGILAIAKTDKAHAALGKLFQTREVEKIYYAWVLQSPLESPGTIDQPIARHPKERLKMTIREGGRKSITHYETQEILTTQRGRKFSLLKINLETGRTHQIRVHMQSIQCPVVGDLLYSRSGNQYSKYGMLLLAKKLSFLHPFTGQSVSAELDFPDRFIDFSQNAARLF